MPRFERGCFLKINVEWCPVLADMSSRTASTDASRSRGRCVVVRGGACVDVVRESAFRSTCSCCAPAPLPVWCSPFRCPPPPLARSFGEQRNGGSKGEQSRATNERRAQRHQRSHHSSKQTEHGNQRDKETSEGEREGGSRPQRRTHAVGSLCCAHASLGVSCVVPALSSSPAAAPDTSLRASDRRERTTAPPRPFSPRASVVRRYSIRRLRRWRIARQAPNYTHTQPQP